MTRARVTWSAAVVVAALLSARADDGTLLARVMPALARHELAALDDVAGLHDPSRSTDALAVAITADEAAADAVAEAVAGDPAYRIAEGPHRIVAELVATGRACALRLSLERRGWMVHTPQPTRRRLAPALAVVPVLAGLASWARWRDRVVGLVVAAVLAQLAVAFWPWPAELPPAGVLDDLVSGPLVAPIIALARGLDDLGTAIAAGVIALCLVLAWFDHRRSPTGSARGLVRGVLAVLAVLALVEAAVRSGWAASCLTLVGAATTAIVIALAFYVPRTWHTQEPAR